MKNKLLSLISLVSLCFMQANGQHRTDNKDSAIFIKLMNMDFHKYIGKSGNIFLHDLGFEFKKAIPITKKPGFIHRVLFSFSDSLSLEIRVKNLGQKERLNFNYKFKTEIFLSKKIEWICLKYAGDCIKGCEYLVCK